MKGAVYYHSKWGNCKEVAEAIAKGLSESGHDIELAAIAADTRPPADLDFIVVGSPTRVGKTTSTVRRFIKRNIDDGWKDRKFAAFGTGLASAREKSEPQSAEHIYWLLADRGLKPLAEPFKAAVEGMKGPLAQGELLKSVKFGFELGESLAKTGEWGVVVKSED